MPVRWGSQSKQPMHGDSFGEPKDNPASGTEGILIGHPFLSMLDEPLKYQQKKTNSSTNNTQISLA